MENRETSTDKPKKKAHGNNHERIAPGDGSLNALLERERTVARISSLFGRGVELDEAIDTSLSEMGRLAGADRAYLFLLRPCGEIIDNTHEWCAPGVSPEKDNLQNLSTSLLPWWMNKLRRLEAIHISDVSLLPPEAAAEKAMLEVQNIKSLLVVPVTIRQELCGFIGFDNVIQPGGWSMDNQSLLSVSSEIIAGALEQDRTMRALRESEIRYRTMVEHMSSGVAVCHAVDDGRDFIFKDFNQAGERIENVRLENILDKGVSQVFPMAGESGLLEAFRRVWRSGKPERFESSWHVDGRLAGCRDIYIYRLPGGELVSVYDDTTERKIIEEQNSRLTQRLITVLDRERVRLSRELHDELGQRIGALVLRIGCLKPDAAPGFQLVRDISETAERVNIELRYICSDLRAVDIDRLGLAPMLDRLARDFQRTTGMPVEFKSDPLKKNEIPREIGIHIYRIMQESLHNAVQHSGTPRISVALRRKNTALTLTVADYGKGICPEDIRSGRGLGIPGMKERAALCHGEIRLEPLSRGGTKVSLEIFLPIKVEDS